MVVEAADAAKELKVVVVVLSKVRRSALALSTRVFCHQVSSYDPPGMYYASAWTMLSGLDYC